MDPAIVVYDLPGHRARCRQCRTSLCAEARRIADAQQEAWLDAAIASKPWKVRA